MMPALVAFASLPFGLRERVYDVNTPQGTMRVHISGLRFTPFLTITSRPELAQIIPKNGQGEGFTTYTWYDHPFVLRVVFGRNVASLGSINSSATIVERLEKGFDIYDETAMGTRRDAFAAQALTALNNLISAVRRKARLYHVFDLRRDDIDISVRDDDGSLLLEDPLHAKLIQEEEEESERFDLANKTDVWYAELGRALEREEPVGLADELLIEAERALAQRFPRQAIATCHTTLEAAASIVLTYGMRRRGLEDREIDHILVTRSLTSKLEILLRRYTGFSLKRDNHELWRRFNELNELRKKRMPATPST